METDDDGLGTVASGECNPAQFRTPLKLLLMKATAPDQVQTCLDNY